MVGARAVRLDAALGATHDRRRFRDVHVFPVTQQEGFALTRRQFADFLVDDRERLIAFDELRRVDG